MKFPVTAARRCDIMTDGTWLNTRGAGCVEGSKT